MNYHGSMLETAMANENFRQVMVTEENIQLLVMCLNPKEEIGVDTIEADQVVFIVSGEGEAMVNDETFAVSGGDVAIVPANSRFNFIANGSEPLKLYIVCTPPKYEESLVEKTK
ncbi:MAG: cupin domain-containing protein [Patescibacteria group bacterium]